MDEPIRDCLGPLRRRRAAATALPEGAWDTHFHVLGPQARFPYSPTRKYTPPDAPLDAACACTTRSASRAAWSFTPIRTASTTRVDLDAVARSGGRYLAVVRLDASATREGCGALHAPARAACASRSTRSMAARSTARSSITCSRCIEGLGWFVELHFEGAALPGLKHWLAAIPATVVIDHFGRVDPALGLEQEPFAVLAGLAARENVWIKISGADRLIRPAKAAQYSDVVPFAHRLVADRADRLLWGSDWPHTGVFDAARMPDDGALVDTLFEFAPDETVRRKDSGRQPAPFARTLGAPHAQTQ